MATSSVAYNKPVLPRVSDTSDLASNRASVYSGKSLNFDGVNDQIQGATGTRLPNSNYTICSWFYMDTLKTHGIVTWGDDTTGERRGMLVWNGSPPGYYCLRSSTYGSNPYGTTQLQAGVWYFGAVTVDSSGNASIYLNGELDGTGTNTLNAFSNTDYIVGNTRSSEWMDGQISAPRVFDVVLTATQIRELYNNPEQILPTGVAAVNLKLWLPMMEGAGSYVYNGAAGSLGEELVSNGTVDEVCQKWAFTDNGYLAATGGKLVWNVPNGSGSTAVQYLDIQANKTYRVTFDYSLNRDGFSVILGNANNASAPVVTGTGTYTIDLTPTSTNDGLFSLNMSAGTGDLTGYMDNISVKEVVPQATGTISGATWVAGVGEPVPQTALIDWNKYPFLDGTGDRYYSPSSMKNFNTLSGGVSAYCRVIVGDKLTNNQNFFSWGDNDGYRIRINTSDYFEAIQDGGSNVLTSSTPCVRGKVHTVVGVVGSGGQKLYVDGQLIASNTTAFINTTSADNLTIGGYNSTSELFDGSVLDVKFWDGALDANTAASMSAGLITPESVTSNQIAHFDGANDYNDKLGNYSGIFSTKEYESLFLIPNGNISGKDILGSAIAKPRSAGAFNFDGNSWAEIQDNISTDMTTSVSVEAWVYNTGKSNGKGIVGKWNYPNYGSYLLYNNSTNSMNFFINDAVGTSGSTSIPTGWSHFVGTYDKTTIKLYKNGALVSSSSYTSNLIDSGSSPVEIGKYSQNITTLYQEEIAFPRIYNYALTAEQVADNFNQKASTFGKTKVVGELQAYINRTVAAGATVEAHSALLNTLTELENK